MRDNVTDGIVMFDDQASGPAENPAPMTLTVDSSLIANNGADGALIIGGTASFSGTTVSGNHANGLNLVYTVAHVTWTAAAQNGNPPAEPQAIRCSNRG